MKWNNTSTDINVNFLNAYLFDIFQKPCAKTIYVDVDGHNFSLQLVMVTCIMLILDYDFTADK